DPLVRALLRLVVDDEERHHRTFRQLATLVRSPAADAVLPEPPVTGGHAPHAPALAAEAAAVRRAIREEQTVARELHRLARSCPDAHEGLVALVLELIARDSRKHALILQEVLRRMGR